MWPDAVRIASSLEHGELTGVSWQIWRVSTSFRQRTRLGPRDSQRRRVTIAVTRLIPSPSSLVQYDLDTEPFSFHMPHYQLIGPQSVDVSMLTTQASTRVCYGGCTGVGISTFYVILQSVRAVHFEEHGTVPHAMCTSSFCLNQATWQPHFRLSRNSRSPAR